MTIKINKKKKIKNIIIFDLQLHSFLAHCGKVVADREIFDEIFSQEEKLKKP